MINTIAVAIIVKNETKDLARCLKSIDPYVHGVYVTATDEKSYDAIRKVVKEIRGSREWAVNKFKWIDDFAAARNFSFAQVPRKVYDWIMWLDADDVVTHGEKIKPLLESLTEGIQAVRANYIVSRDAKGEPMLQHYHTRIVKNNGRWHWEGIYHEVLVPSRGGAIQAETPLFNVEQMPKLEFAMVDPKARLKLIAREYNRSKSARAQFYLARELKDWGDFKNALPHYAQYLERPDAWWEEKFQACRQVVSIYESQANYYGALHYCWRNLDIEPKAPEAYFDIARQYYFLKRWDRVAFWSEMGGSMFPIQWQMTHNPLDVTLNWIIYYTVALFNLGKYKQCIEWSETALRLDPKAPYHTENIERATKALELKDAATTPAIR